MTRAQAIDDAYLLATGKYPAPTTGSKRNRLTALAKKFYRDWQTEPGEEWDILSSDVSAGTVTATDTFELDEEINYISKKLDTLVRIEVSPTNTTYYRVVPASDLSKYAGQNVVAQMSTTEIKFATAFPANSPLLGGTIKVPAILKLEDLDSDSSEVLIINPAWLPARMAAQYVMTDNQLSDLYPDLLDQANELMRGMKQANDPASPTTSTGIDYFGSLGNVGSGASLGGGSRTDTIW